MSEWKTQTVCRDRDRLMVVEVNGDRTRILTGSLPREIAEQIIADHQASVVLAAMKDKHKELAAGRLWNGPHGVCAACMLPYPCKVAQAISNAESSVTR